MERSSTCWVKGEGKVNNGTEWDSVPGIQNVSSTTKAAVVAISFSVAKKKCARGMDKS